MKDQREEVCAALIGKVIEGVTIDADNETVSIVFNNGVLEFSGDGLQMYYEVDKVKQ